MDYALLARRKAELAAQGDDIADEELEALAKGVAKSKSKGEDKQEKKVEAEPMAKGVSSRPLRPDCALTIVQIHHGQSRRRRSEEEKEEEEG